MFEAINIGHHGAGGARISSETFGGLLALEMLSVALRRSSFPFHSRKVKGFNGPELIDASVRVSISSKTPKSESRQRLITISFGGIRLGCAHITKSCRRTQSRQTPTFWTKDGVSGNRLDFPLSGILGSLDPFHNQPLGPVYIYPLADVAPFVSFQIFIMREEVRNLIR